MWNRALIMQIHTHAQEVTIPHTAIMQSQKIHILNSDIQKGWMNYFCAFNLKIIVAVIRR